MINPIRLNIYLWILLNMT